MNGPHDPYFAGLAPSKFKTNEISPQHRGVNFLELSNERSTPEEAGRSRHSSENNTVISEATAATDGTDQKASMPTRGSRRMSTVKLKEKKEDLEAKSWSVSGAYMEAASTPMGRLLVNLKPRNLMSTNEHRRWVANHLIDFFNELWMLYGCLVNVCSRELCPCMSAGRRHKYLWANGETVTEPQACSAPEYCYRLFFWVECKINDEHFFPLCEGGEYPKSLLPLAKTILKKLFRVYAHMMRRHYLDVKRLGIAPMLNESFARFAYFVLQNKLVRRSDMSPLKHLIDHWAGRSLRLQLHSGKSKSKPSVTRSASAVKKSATRRWSLMHVKHQGRSMRATSEPRLKQIQDPKLNQPSLRAKTLLANNMDSETSPSSRLPEVKYNYRVRAALKETTRSARAVSRGGNEDKTVQRVAALAIVRKDWGSKKGGIVKET